MKEKIPYFPDVPPYSCDFNPIENIWSILKTATGYGRIKEEWEKIDQEMY